MDLNYDYEELIVRTQGYGNNSAYTFSLAVDEYETSSGTKRKVHICYDVYAISPGGYQSYTSPKAYIIIDGEVVKSKTVKNIWPREEYITLFDFDVYLESGIAHSITARFNSGTSDVDYLPQNGNKNINMSFDVTPTCAVLNNITKDNDFITNGIFTPSFTDQIGSRYYKIGLYSNTTSETLISKENAINVTSGNTVTLNSATLNKIYEILRNNSNSINLKWILYTYNDSTYSTYIGSTQKSISSFCSIPNYTLSWDVLNLEDANATDQYNNQNLSYYLPTGYLAKLLSKAKITFSAISNKGTCYGKIVNYKVNNASHSSPYTQESNYNGESFVVSTNVNDPYLTSELSSTLTPNIINYFRPNISNISIARPSAVSDKMVISYKIDYYDGTDMNHMGSNENKCTYDFYYNQDGSNTWTKVTALSGEGTSGSATFSNIQISNLDYTKPFYFKIEVSDRLGVEIAPTGYVPRGLPVWNAYTDSNDNNVMNINGNFIVTDDATIGGDVNINGNTTIGGTLEIGTGKVLGFTYVGDVTIET